MPELLLRRGLTALHQRLLHVIRTCDTAARPSQTNEAATALSLMLLGHNGILEGVVRDAARYAAGAFTPEATDDDIIAAFLSRLPVSCGGEPVRALFFADFPPHSAVDERLAELIQEYKTMTDHDSGSVRSAFLRESSEARDLAVDIVEMLLRPAAAWQPTPAAASAATGG